MDMKKLIGIVMLALVGLSCPAYGALYVFIGALLHRRAMVAAVAYTLLMEFVVSFIPAMVNQLTVQYRLRNLLLRWMNWETMAGLRDPNARQFFSEAPAWQHVLILVALTAGLLTASVWLIQRREFAQPDEG